MSENVLQHLESTKSEVVAKASLNQDVANMFMGLLGSLILMASKRGMSIESVQIGNPMMSGNEVKTNVTFKRHVLKQALPLGADTSDFFVYAKSKSANMARAMERNPQFIQFFTRLLLKLESYCAFKGYDYSKIKITKAFINADGVLVLEVSNGIGLVLA